VRSERLIKIKKDRLVATVTTNRDEHRDQFLAAQKKYREKVIEILDERLATARKGGRIDVYISLPVPVDYTNEYSAALAALDWEVEDHVYLSQSEFNRLVLNDWEWKRDFAANTQSYLASDQ
jgi:hypothetical protein